MWPDGREHSEADRFLREHDGAGAQRTYAYLLVDHLRWIDRECLALDTAAGFRALATLARLADDPLACPAGALRAQLVEAHPQLLSLETS